jgi:putative glycosyltransferase (TIGR04372 family)
MERYNRIIACSVQILRQCVHFFAIFLCILCCPISFLLKKLGIRVLVSGNAIGHFTCEPDAFLKEQVLGRLPKYRTILFPPFRPLISKCPWKLASCNNYLAFLWKQRFWVLTNPIAAFFLYPILGAPFLKKPFFFRSHLLLHYHKYYTHSVGNTIYDINTQYFAKFSNFGPEHAFLKLPDADKAKGQKILRKLGLMQDDWFVCFFAREPGFYDSQDVKRQGIRNGDVNTYAAALLEISKRGGWCIRMGSSKMNPLSPLLKQIPRVVDYPQTSYVSEFMDIFLASSCRFFLGAASGITLTSGIFGIPAVVVNLVPLDTLPVYPQDIGIFKLHYSLKENRLLSFPEVYSNPILCSSNSNQDFIDFGVEVINNTEEEILEVVKEMLARLDQRFIEDDEYLALLKSFKSWIPSNKWSKNASSKIGSHFLKKYVSLYTQTT